MKSKFMTTHLLLAIAGSTKKVVEKPITETVANTANQQIIWSKEKNEQTQKLSVLQ